MRKLTGGLMGLLIDGKWHDQWYDTKTSKGKFVRQDSKFRHWIGDDGFEAESGRYHLFVSLACPWAHRTLIFRHLKGLADHISVTTVDPLMLSNGWEFSSVSKNNPVLNVQFLYEIYTTNQADYSGRVTVPILWDKKHQRIVNNESSEIIRMFNERFSEFSNHSHDYYPENLRAEIDTINDKIYHTINNGVYKCGFATTQEAYEDAYHELFNTLDELEERLGSQRYLVGDKITEADWRLFTTLVRFDAVYFGHFKTNKQRIDDYPNLSQYLRELYQVPGIKETTNFEHIKSHYYYSHTSINPTQIIPVGPDLNLDAPHHRDSF